MKSFASGRMATAILRLRLVPVFASILCFPGCAPDITEVVRDPQLTPVGTGLRPDRINAIGAPVQRPVYTSRDSFWQDRGADLFRDPRAVAPGDLVTVKISIKDRASLDNSTNRKRQSTRDLDLKLNYSLNTANVDKHLQAKGDGELAPSVSSNTSTKGEGGISRSESIDLLVAAVVTDVLPNGNLVISGTQEVKVNAEIRELSVAGIVRPRDIATDNSISYDKIAEARISYAGRGRVTEVQQPGWGHTLFDAVSPF